jgi:hypothetical protein
MFKANAYFKRKSGELFSSENANRQLYRTDKRSCQPNRLGFPFAILLLIEFPSKQAPSATPPISLPIPPDPVITPVKEIHASPKAVKPVAMLTA